LKARFSAAGASVAVESRAQLTPARERPLDDSTLRSHLGRLGDTPFVLDRIDRSELPSGLFLPLSELNHVRQEAVLALTAIRRAGEDATRESRRERIAAETRRDVASRSAVETAVPMPGPGFNLAAEVFAAGDARTALDAGATEIVFDPFLRHPLPSLAKVRALAAEVAAHGATLRLRTPTIVRPEDRRALEKWLALGTSILSGHAGLACELAAAGRDVVADYAVNCFNQFTAAELFGRGVARITGSVELTVGELGELVAPWQGSGFEVIAYGRPEGMTLEHCVLSAAFDRQPGTCRDLCVQKHRTVTITDPAGYSFPVATDSDCRNRLLHSRPIEGSEFLPALWKSGVRSYRLVFNVPGDPVESLVAAYRRALESLGTGRRDAVGSPRALVGRAFTRGHFTRAV
jgi:putative protease